MATTKKNLLTSGDVYNAYYGDFRGVDFSSDHTQVHKQRLAYSVNMFKDYQSGQGQALETIPGFRRRVELPGNPVVYGIHHFCRGDNTRVLIHADDKLYLWHNYPRSINVAITDTVALPKKEKEEIGGTTIVFFDVQLGDNVEAVKEVITSGGENIFANTSYSHETHLLRVNLSNLSEGDILTISFLEGVIEESSALYSKMNAHRSTSFVMNNRLYIIDGKNYLVYDWESETVKSVLDVAYIPTTYVNIVPSGENADIGTEYEQRNILQSKFKHTFIADGETTKFFLNENELDEITEILVYGKDYTNGKMDGDNYLTSVSTRDGSITFANPPPAPQTNGYPDGYAGIKITAKKTLKTDANKDLYTMVTNCTIATVFDNRVFLSGNPDYPNHIFFCSRNTTGYTDPTYFGILNYAQDGVGVSPVTGMIPVADTLMALKSDTQQDGSVYFHTAVETGIDLKPVIYPATQGLNGIGCIGTCVNFLDDPVFISRLGVEAIGQLSVRYERAVEHRSSLIDAKLVNCDLSKACLEEWNGYLILLVDGKIFMADSRQKYTHAIGVAQYEWYYIEGIGVYEDQYTEYRYATQLYSELDGKTVKICTTCKKSESECTCDEKTKNLVEIPIKLADNVYYGDTNETVNLADSIVNAPDDNGKSTVDVLSSCIEFEVGNVTYKVKAFYTIHESSPGSYEAFLCDTRDNKTGGVFKKATIVKTMDSNLFFGTENGVICSFNFDMRDENGEIAPRYYNFDGRIIFSGCATRMDCCDVPHLTKNTVKKSTVIKTKSLQSSAVKIKVRTNRKPYEQIARINSTVFSFDSIDFSDFTFISSEQSLFMVKEKEKKWVEKQYFLYSDEFMKPFALYYISFRYTIAGRYKE